MEEKGNLYYKTAYLYDLDPRPNSKDDIPFYLEYATKAGGDVLDLACGSGRVSIPLAEAGFNVWAVDLSEIMLGLLKDKMTRLPAETAERIQPIQGNMKTFTAKKKFPLIILPYRSFLAMIERDEQLQCLQTIHDHLTPDGIFIMNVFKPFKDFEKEWVKNEEILDWENTDPETGRIIKRCHTQPDIDTKKKVVSINQVYYIKNNGGPAERLEETISIKYITADEIRGLLDAGGFRITAEWGYYDKRPIGEGSELIFICRKQ
ncbi:MAG: class I SAM-dependent methyltransferase [bacterium]|nr:class I SAM-dependent methyltransferase [bacterium]